MTAGAADLRRAATRSAAALRHTPDVDTLRADAAVALLVGHCDRAVADLTEALALAPGSAPAWSDLAAARLERARLRADPYDVFLALGAAGRAVAREPTLLAARFNRAVALERLSLEAQALEQWRLYLRGERDPHWRREAAARAAALQPPQGQLGWELARAQAERLAGGADQRQIEALVARWPQRFREHLEQAVLVSWAEAEGQHRAPAAGSLLAVADALAGALTAVNGERLAADVVLQIRHAREAGTGKLRGLVQGIRRYGRGLSLANRSDFARALFQLQLAREALATRQCPLAGWADFWIAFCHYQRSDYRRAQEVLRGLAGHAERDRYPALLGRALSLSGLIELITGHPTASLSVLEESLGDFTGLHESANAAKAGALLASNLDYLGRRADAWRRLYSSLREPAASEPLTRSTICDVASLLALEDGEPEIALWFQDEVLRGAQSMGAAYAVAAALRSHGSMLAALGRRDEAARDLDQAARGLDSIADPAARRSLEGDVRLAQGKLARARSPRAAIGFLDAAIRLFRTTSYHFQLGQALYERALAEKALGRGPEVELDLEAAILESERQRGGIFPPEQRVSYFERTRALLDEMIALQLARQRPTAALIYSEQAKARVLLDWLVAQPVGPRPAIHLASASARLADARSLVRGLPPGLSVVEYASLPQRLAIWIVRRGDVQVETVAVDAPALTALVERFVRSVLIGPRADFLESSARLHDLLVRPLANHVGAGERMVFVPDGILHAVSFALLRDRRSGRYLAQDHASSVAPSISVYAASVRRDRSLASGEGARVLAMGDPDFDTQLFPSLPRLPAAAIETAVARSFVGSVVLNGRAATREAFLRLAGYYEIVHFGGHSLVDAEFPLLSQMVFALDRSDPSRGVLHAGDLLGRRLQRTRLAVLASCSTASGKIYRTEGVENLARPFLAAGVPAVVASLWKVSDEATSQFFVRFYRHLKQGFDVSAALQATQAECLASGPAEAGDPRVWGAFELIGGSASDGRLPR